MLEYGIATIGTYHYDYREILLKYILLSLFVPDHSEYKADFDYHFHN